MKRIFLSILFFIVAWPTSTSFSAQEIESPVMSCQTLQSCYQMALKQSEIVAVQRELITEAEGRILQLLGAILPDVSYSYSYERQDSGGTGSSFRQETPEGKFTFSQPLFSGFKEFAAIAAGRSQARQREHELNRAKQLLLRDVSDAFYFYLSYQQDIETLESVHKILGDRLEELNKREELGRSRPSELAGIEAKTLRLEAEIELIRSHQEVAGQLLEFLTGAPVITLEDDSPLERNLGSLDAYLENVQKRPDVLAFEEAVKQSQKQITIARSGYWPEVSLDANKYTKRVGSSENVEWDATLDVDMPIFQVVETRGAVKQAQAKSEQADLKYEEIKRRAALEIKNAYSQLQAAFRRYDTLSKAVEATQRNYDLQLEDFEFNLVNHLDVLQALEDLEDSRREYIAIQNELKQIYWRFYVAIGKVPYDTF
ncbi:MAG: TolC family protein [Candidatus Omnitrophica bacterium]|nr:TolC family protein [Candidatus Omnitrophota bacterium]